MDVEQVRKRGVLLVEQVFIERGPGDDLAPMQGEVSPIMSIGCGRPAARRMSARIRASSSSMSNGFVR